ncbi:5-methyltetrahydropteroyltriglutamate--homocysteine S-methyltransferase [Thioalkalivibrio thiocyanodenitrificans]|uniref:5-methyltetrahydropteroyltriglutamate-- homocysteine S-methyltransferase n=1 Tax=Thioalkalivibrio thiocyanodenitrificans TaxID=243063 RepID=UPI00036D89EC|nr:5-methyltetrahydropteroyltriglutamate--homocysteine S-methyltransferase [Thioalkalivibrio thiocyanodenitrificans]
MTMLHVPGYPRIGVRRELKFALERHWRGEITEQALEETGRELRLRHWAQQRDAGMSFVTVGDFAFYDHVLEMIDLLGCAPARFGFRGDESPLSRQFAMARGTPAQPALEMTKWFDTNYHYLVPELSPDTAFTAGPERLLEQVGEARGAGHPVKAVLVGPLTFLWLSKMRGPDRRLELLETLLDAYRDVLGRLAEAGVAWVQMDEPVLALELTEAWRTALATAYRALHGSGPKMLLAGYFGALGENLSLACMLPVQGLHVDAVRAPQELLRAAQALPSDAVLSAGIIDGRNVWRADPDAVLAQLVPLRERLDQRLWLSTSCSLLHVPHDLGQETDLDPELRGWLSFARQKLDELRVLGRVLDAGESAEADALKAARSALAARRRSPRVCNERVRQRVAVLDAGADRRTSPYGARQAAQRARLELPCLPTTTIGSFPQTREIRAARADHRAGRLNQVYYRAYLQTEIARVIRLQESLGLDVLVHGEPERNDMVQYFGEQLDGVLITRHGWVQSYGSRCVNPPVIYGDVSRPAPMTVDWTTYAQGLTPRPVKGMLTGPVTILQWSFVRDDQPRTETCLQLALAIRDEALDLERAGIGIIQIDEPAFREGLPLARSHWDAYLDWAARCFRIAAGGVRDDTRIHTHMCYSEFNDILPAIAAMDADVITIETSRSHMELLNAFAEFHYPNGIGPGVYDVHAPRVPSVEEMTALLEKAVAVVSPGRLWVNPDCGLKTRTWPETRAALENMVYAAQVMRERLNAETGSASGIREAVMK